MPEGPFGLPRLTDIGPFAQKEAEQHFRRETGLTQYRHYEDEVIEEVFDADVYNANFVRSELIVKVKPKQKHSGVLGKIRDEIKSVTSDTEVSHLSYWMDTSSGVAKISSAHTKEGFRGMGVATQLKEKELDYMKRNGVEVVLTDVVSEGGYRLAKATGFLPITQTDINSEELVFYDDSNKGFMVRYL